jgi:hypothetical protein
MYLQLVQRIVNNKRQESTLVLPVNMIISGLNQGNLLIPTTVYSTGGNIWNLVKTLVE